LKEALEKRCTAAAPPVPRSQGTAVRENRGNSVAAAPPNRQSLLQLRSPNQFAQVWKKRLTPQGLSPAQALAVYRYLCDKQQMIKLVTDDEHRDWVEGSVSKTACSLVKWKSLS
jgi:hypothetical protein